MLSAQQLRQVLPTVTRGAIRGPWYRAIAFDYLLGPPPGAPPGSAAKPLWPGGAPLRGARFTPRQTRPTAPGTAAAGFGSVYLAEDELTPILEIAGVLRPPNSPVPLLFEPQVLMTVDGILTDIVDITDGQVQSALGTNLQELTGSWVVAQASYLAGTSAMPPTQVLGQAAYDVGGIVGLRYPSSKSASGAAAVVVFSDRLSGGQSYLQVFNKPGGSLTDRLPWRSARSRSRTGRRSRSRGRGHIGSSYVTLSFDRDEDSRVPRQQWQFCALAIAANLKELR